MTHKTITGNNLNGIEEGFNELLEINDQLNQLKETLELYGEGDLISGIQFELSISLNEMHENLSS